MCENSADRLSGPPFVVVEDPAQPFMALNTRIHVDHTVRLLDQPTIGQWRRPENGMNPA